ncbi:MAG: hypothetical protein NUW21_07830 [Elusimicrobia bacterium]|nr:hypothetical protein [Elusimicrobiota bacterium]
MNRIIMKLAPVATALAVLSLTGCMKYTLTPERPAELPRAAAPPLPLKVGVSLEKDDELGARFVEGLRQARLFADVFHPVAPGAAASSGVDLLITGRFGTEYVADPLQAPKIFLAAFTGFITGALMSETSHHLARGALTVAYPDGRLVKTYDEKADVVAVSMVSAFAEAKTMKLGPPAARDNLVAALVRSLIDDRAAFEKPREPAPRPVPQLLAVAEPVPLPVAEPAPAVSRPPEPAPRRPLTPEEEAEIDDQLFP